MRSRTALRRTTGFARAAIPVLAGAALVGAMLVATGGSGAGHSHEAPGSRHPDAAHMALPAGVLEFSPPGEGRWPVTLAVDVVIDEEFSAATAGSPVPAVTAILDDADRLLAQVGLRLRLASVQSWTSDDDTDSLSTLLDQAAEAADHTPGRLLLVITRQDTVTYDGWARHDAGQLAVRSYQGGVWRTGSLIAHEIGHLLGAGHHEDDEGCESGGCLMDRAGYAHARQWCDHHRQEVQAALAEAQPPARG